MGDQEYTAQNNERMNMLKKRLFILAAYILVSAILLAYVSYGQFKITRKGDTTLPAAEGFYATISLRENEDADATVLTSELLSGLLPGDNAMTFATDDIANRKLTLTVTPSEAIAGEDGTTTTYTSTLDLQYAIRIYSDRSIPLQFVLVDPTDSTKKYVSSYEDGVYKFYNESEKETVKITSWREKETDYYKADTASGEVLFNLPANNAATQTCLLYVGWDTMKDTGNKYRKEVDVLKIGAQITAKSGPDNPAPAQPMLPYTPESTT